MLSQEKFYEIQKKIEQKIVEEESKEISVDYFFAYSNLVREFLPLNKDYNFKKLWKKYITYVKITDYYRNQPDVFKSELNGIENLEYLKDGGAIISLHYGNYRNALYTVAKRVLKKYHNKQFRILVDTDSYNNEPREWVENEINGKYLIAESPTIVRDLINLFKNNGILFIFIDGNAGSGVDKNAVQFKFITSHIKIRSGFFRILDRVKKPILPLVASGTFEKPVLHLGAPVYNEFNDLSVYAKDCYKLFLKHIEDKPEFWRFWFRHHLHVESWNSELEDMYKISKMYLVRDNQKFVVDESTGKILKSQIQL